MHYHLEQISSTEDRTHYKVYLRDVLLGILRLTPTLWELVIFESEEHGSFAYSQQVDANLPHWVDDIKRVQHEFFLEALRVVSNDLYDYGDTDIEYSIVIDPETDDTPIQVSFTP